MKDGDLLRCILCQEDKSPSEMAKTNKKYIKSGYKNYCKKCSALRELKRRSKFSKQKKQELSLQSYKTHTNKIQSDLNYAIKSWCLRWRNRIKGVSKHEESKKNVSKEKLIELANIALKKFPYLKFSNNKEKWETPSVDRIDSSKEYSDDNIQIIPLWLNSAKLDMSENKLIELMKSYLNQEQ